MSTNRNTNVNVGGGFFMGLAILLMIVGFVMENADYYPELGAILFTVGFWLFVIPLIIVAIVFAVFIGILALKS